VHAPHGCPGNFALLVRVSKAYLCIAQFLYPVTAMLTFFIYFTRRKRAFAWSPAVDLSDPYVAAALVPTMNS
jgi:hypothetical protein